MAYRILRFDGVSLPELDAQRNQGSGIVDGSVLDSVGGAFNYYGSQQRKPRRMQFDVRGKYVGETRYEIDHNGNFIVDHNNNFIITGDGANHLRGQIEELKAKRGARGQLIRVRFDDESVEQWKMARLLDVQYLQKADDRLTLAEIVCIFETTMVDWRSTNQVTTSKSLTNGAPDYLYVENDGGVQIDDAVITVTRTSGTITSFTLTGNGIAITWTGTIGAGQAVVLDAGLMTAKRDTTDVYSGLSFGGHTVNGWLPLRVGLNSLLATVNGGNATFAIGHYNQWP